MTDQEPIRFADRMNQLPPYLFGMINKLRMEKRWAGDDVIDLGMGNPADPTPETVTRKVCEVIEDPKTHRYPVADGLKHLREEIARSYLRDYGVALDRDKEVICTIGSKEGLSHMCLALVGPGDTVLVPAPAFPIHIYSAIIAGGNVIRVPLGDDQVFIDRIVTMCENIYPRPKLLILNFPHNPTAALGTLDLFEAVVDLARRFGFMVMQDFAYAKIGYDGYKAPSFLEVPGAREVGVEFGSFSKTYNMAGWRLGYCVGNRQIIEGLAKIKGYYDYGIFSPIQVAGIWALRHCEDDIARQVDKYQIRRDIMCEGLQRMGWPVETPKAGMFAWVRLPSPFDRMGSMKFALDLMEKAKVAVAPGIGFGEEGEGCLRLALVENEHRIRQAIRQMRRALPVIAETVS
ncbi:MAG: aminotransferase class I/II-fold pyridoxal phosphate-dependent enzyme [Desulfobacterales bacterium]|jgi:alanine-synthesizing transaminase